MADSWKNLWGATHTGSWGTPELGLTEGLSNLLWGGGGQTSEGGSNLSAPATAPAELQAQQNLAASQGAGGRIYTDDSNPANRGGITTGGGGGGTSTGGNTGGGGGGTSGIDDAQRRQEEAARSRAEAARQAARSAYQGKVRAAETAKGAAQGQYDWIKETLGSNRRDTLEQITLNEGQGVENYQAQESKTQRAYAKAKGEILSTYRDLQREQEKLLRGSGMAQSSRSLEAAMRLNNLLGKDMANLSTNEADALTMIGNAITHVKEQARLARQRVETEVKSKLDKAALDYNNQVNAINTQLYLDENQREDEYKRAEAQLASDIANIESWASGLKLQAQQATAAMTGQLDSFITDMTDQNGLLNSGLAEKEAATNQLLTQAGYTPLDQISGQEEVTAGVYQSPTQAYNSKEELDEALANGQISELEYNRQLAALQGGGTGSGDNLLASLASPQVANTSATLSPTLTNRDLLTSMLA